MKRISPLELGATLYMPAVRSDILQVVLGERLPGLKSLVICLEDAVSESDVEQGIKNLRQLLWSIKSAGGRPLGGPLVFVRPRNAEMAAMLCEWPDIALIDGFVAPKMDTRSIEAWSKAMSRPEILLMPTLETAEVFDPGAMVSLREALKYAFGERIIALRIGGNDLMGCLGLRRSKAFTLYDSPMGYVIPMLSGIMGAGGFALTAPVFERIDNESLLKEELAKDIGHGLVGKTAIHPSQIEIINNAFRVDPDDAESARKILAEDAQAVFKHGGAMCEPATHLKWARRILDREMCYGTSGVPAAVPTSTQSLRAINA
jgi:citrate lyase beta subunit